MREFVKSNLETIIWIWVGLSILGWLAVGLTIIQVGTYMPNGYSLVSGVAAIIGGAAGSLVLAGICFQIMDMRKFTKHSAMSLHRGQTGGAS